MIVVTGIKRLFWFRLVFDIYIFKCFSFCICQAKEFEVLKVVCEYLISVFDRDVRGLK